MVVTKKELLPVPFKSENAIRLIYEGEEILPNERFLPKYNEVIRRIGTDRIIESGLRFEDAPICIPKKESFHNGNGSYTVDKVNKVQTPSGGRRVKILQILKEGLNLDLEIIVLEATTAQNKKEVVITIDGKKFQGSKLKDCYIEAIKYCGLKNVYDLHIKYNPNPDSKECFDIVDFTPYPQYQSAELQEEGQSYYIHYGMRNLRTYEILTEICERLGLELSADSVDSALRCSFSVEYKGTTYQEKDDKNTVMRVMREIGIERIKTECAKTTITINKEEYPLINDTKLNNTHYLEFEDEGCYVPCSRIDRQQVLIAIEKTMHLGLKIQELKNKDR